MYGQQHRNSYSVGEEPRTAPLSLLEVWRGEAQPLPLAWSVVIEVRYARRHSHLNPPQPASAASAHRQHDAREWTCWRRWVFMCTVRGPRALARASSRQAGMDCARSSWFSCRAAPGGSQQSHPTASVCMRCSATCATGARVMHALAPMSMCHLNDSCWKSFVSENYVRHSVCTGGKKGAPL